MRIRALTISELNSYISNFMKADPILHSVRVEGEVSNLKFHSSGNIYFTLKDENSRISCIVFGNSDITEEISEGDKIICQGKINYYERDGSVSIIISKIDKTGVGELYRQFIELRNKLEKEGLFDEAHKKEIPQMPRRIGVVTSPTGAVIRDIYNVISKKFPKVEIIVYPALVQGDRAYEEVIEGLRYFNGAARTKSPDVIIVARGGGSYEELAIFNNESLALEIFDSRIPVVSAIGHENDFTIADFVSDLRASTPSMAAELTVPSFITLKKELETLINQLNRESSSIFEDKRQKLSNIKRIFEMYNPLEVLSRKEEEIFKFKTDLHNHMIRAFETQRILLNSRKEHLLVLNPLNLLDRGYTTVYSKETKLVTRASELKEDEVIKIRFYDGTVVAKIIGGSHEN